MIIPEFWGFGCKYLGVFSLYIEIPIFFLNIDYTFLSLSKKNSLPFLKESFEIKRLENYTPVWLNILALKYSLFISDINLTEIDLGQADSHS